MPCSGAAGLTVHWSDTTNRVYGDWVSVESLLPCYLALTASSHSSVRTVKVRIRWEHPWNKGYPPKHPRATLQKASNADLACSAWIFWSAKQALKSEILFSRQGETHWLISKTIIISVVVVRHSVELGEPVIQGTSATVERLLLAAPAVFL